MMVLRILIEKISKHWQNNNKRRLFENIIFLQILRFVNLVFPLITVPYLIRVLGVEKFGLIAFAQAFMRFFIIVSEYGFGFTATREISIHRNNRVKVSEIVSSVLTVKLILVLVCFLFLSITIFTFSKFRMDCRLYLLSFGMVIGYALFPVWFFQGMEKMKYTTMLNIIAKVIFVMLIFVFIKKQSSYIFVPLLNSLGFIISGVIGIWTMIKNFNITLMVPSIPDIKAYFKEGSHIFLSTVAVSLYRETNVFILGLFSSVAIVGYYATAEKILKTVQSLIDPISQALFPNLSKRFSEQSLKNSIILLKKISKMYFFLLITLSGSFFIMAPQVSKILWERVELCFINDMRMLSLAIFFGGFNFLLGVVGLVNLNYKNFFLSYVLIVGITNILLSIVLVWMLDDLGAAIALLGSEILLFCLCVSKIVKLFKNKRV